MGNLPSREKPLSIPAASADTSQLPLPTQAVPSGFQALALCDFPSSVGVATVLRMGEQVCILSEDGEWWQVASKVSGKECHIPSSCVAKIRHGWLYEGISQEKAKELLLHPGNHSGSFLIRESQTRQGCYSLSVHCSGLSESLLHPPAGQWMALYLHPAHLPQPAQLGGPLLCSLLFSETTSPSENSPISHSLKEAISSYLILPETDTPEPNPTGKVVKNS